MARIKYPEDDPRRKLPEYAIVTLSGKSDGELGHIPVQTPRGLTHRGRLMLMRRFAAHPQAHADDYEGFWLRRRRRRRDQAGDSGAAACGE
jgi:hypothetical protein